MSAARLPGAAIVRRERLAGGDLSTVERWTLADGRSAIAKSGGDTAGEAAMLRAIAATGAPAPDILACDETMLVMTDLPTAGDTAWDDLAMVLGRLHAVTGPDYGWDRDYAFGPVAIANTRDADWPRFWADRRLCCHLPHIDAVLGRRIEALDRRIGDLLPSRPPASLLHGDLWGGNILVSGGRVSGLVDPACYHGDREVDLAMLTLFDHPPERFFAAVAPEPGWRARLPVYRLWPLLVHLRLFGDGYRVAVERDLTMLGV